MHPFRITRVSTYQRRRIGTISDWLITFDILVSLMVKQHFYFRTRDGGGGRGRFEIVP